MDQRKQKKRFLRSPQLLVEPDCITSHIKIDDLRDLLTWCYCSKNNTAPKWIGVENRAGIEHVVSLMVPGLPVDKLVESLDDCKPQPVKAGVVSALDSFDYGWPTKAAGHRDHVDPPETTFTKIPFTKAEKNEQKRQRIEDESKQANSLVPLGELVLDPQLKSRLGFINIPPDNEWKITSFDPAESKRAFAVDCEMCVTAKGKELTRVSVVDEDLQCIYSTFVKPNEPIIDYVTQYSGITAEKLEGVETTLKDVQQWFIDNLKPGDVLVGHSIDCDLEALKLIHPNLIDTGLLFAHPKGLPFRHALKWLVKKYCDLDIQTGADGHHPTEDAAACIRLLKLKRERGINFGSWPQNKSLIETLKCEGKSTAIIDYGIPFWDTTQSAKSIVSVSSDDEVVDRVGQLCTKHDYTFARLRELERADESIYSKVLEATNERIAKILESIPPRSIVIVWTGYGDRSFGKPLLDKKMKWRREFKVKKLSEIPEDQHWTDQDEEALKDATVIARMGLSFIKMIPGDLPRKAARLE